MIDSEVDSCWVRTKALNVAIYGNQTSNGASRGSSDHRPEDGSIDWGWAHADVIQLKDPIRILVNDEDYSAFHGRTVELPADSFELGNVVMGNKHSSNDEFGGGVGSDDDEEDSVDRYPDDLITLTHLHEPAVVHCLRRRYAFDEIYTATGPILLALNPFKNCKHLYSSKIQQKYCDRGEAVMRGDASAVDAPLEPHVYQIADNAFRDMMRAMAGHDASSGAGGGNPKRRTGTGRGGKLSTATSDQSILVSGESGAGKTVTTKIIMQYLASLSQRSSSTRGVSEKQSKKGNDAGGGSGGEETNIEQQVLQSNPILESFGNARTIRNDNSSRFGKFIEIEFSRQGGSLLGASIETYLLEKVRLISPSEGERNYHIFYEVFRLPEEELEAMYLEDYSVEDFKMTNQSGTFDRRDGVEDEDTLGHLLSAMETMGIRAEEKGAVLSIAAAALHASNLTFLEVSADESTLEPDNPHLAPFCSLMGITTDALDRALCYQKIRAGRDVNTRTLSRSKAEKGLEAVIKAFYGALFNFLVRRINDSITVKKSSGRSMKTTHSCSRRSGGAKIGVLDIFGFESFKINSFEQLCINYCNEALQQQFNLFVLKNEQAEYEREGIEWSFIQFPDNQDVLDLIDKKGSGILNILDDQCRAPGTTDKTFSIDLYKKCTAHPRFMANHRQVGAQKFAIRHYAGVVEYGTDGFVEKNRDDLPREASDLLKSSTKEIVRTLASIISDPEDVSKDGKGASRSLSPHRKSGGKPTVGGQFGKQLRDLRSKIDLTSPHYIRCLKPNDVLVPDHFNPSIIADQLRYAGVVEAVRVSRVGYPQRYSHAAFTSRYRILALHELKKAQRASRRVSSVNTVVNAVSAKVWKLRCQENGDRNGEGERRAEKPPSLVAAGMQVGKTKVFLRRRAFELLEQLRVGKISDCAAAIQTVGRRYVARREYLWTRQSLVRVQSWVRMRAAAQCVQAIRLDVRSTTLQTRWRSHAARNRYLAMKAVAMALQKVQRGRLGRKRYAQLNQIRKAIVVQKYWKRLVCRQYYLRMQRAISTLQCAIRCYFARRVRTELKMKARDFNNVVEERNALREDVKSLRAEMNKMSQTLSAVKSSARDTVSTDVHAATLKQVEDLSKRISELKSVHEESEKKAQAEADRANNAERIVEETKAEAENVRQAAQKAEEQIRILTLDLSESKDELEARTSELLSVREESRTSKAAQQKASQSAEEEIAALREDKKAMETVRRAKDAIAKDLEDLREEQDFLDKKYRNLELLRDELLLAKADLERDGEERRKELSALRKERDDIVKERDDALEGANKENRHFEEIEKLQREIGKLRGENTGTTSPSESLRIEKAQTSATDSELPSTERSPELGVELEEARSKIIQLERELLEAKANDATKKEEARAREQEVEEESKDLTANLQDEVDRLTKELAKAKCRGDDDDKVPDIPRYMELKRLTEAVLDKDGEIERLKAQLNSEQTENAVAFRNETEQLKLHTNKLHKEVEKFRMVLRRRDIEKKKEPTGKMAFGGFFFMRRKQHSEFSFDKTVLSDFTDDTNPAEEEEDHHDLGDEVDGLKQVNEMLRTDVEKSHEKMSQLERELAEEKERASKELESYGKTLTDADALRVAAQTMRRGADQRPQEIIPSNQSATYIIRPKGYMNPMKFKVASKIIDKAKSIFETQSKKATQRSHTWWMSLPLYFRSSNSRVASKNNTLCYPKKRREEKTKGSAIQKS